MRVLVFTNMWPTDDDPAFGCFVREQVEDLRQLGIQVRVLSFDARRDWRNYLRAAKEIRRVVADNGFDLVHAHYGLTGAVALAQTALPIVTTFHGAETGYVPWQGRVSWFVARRTYPVFVSDEGRQDLGRSDAPIIPAGVDTSLFTPHDREESRRALGWEVGARFALFPGRRTDLRKRPDLFDAAVREARTLHPDLLSVSLEGLGRQEVARVLNAVDVTVMTSDQEGSPVTVRESLACLTPVVSVSVGDVEAVLRRLPGCAIVPRDPGAIAKGIAAAIQSDRSPELRRRAELTSRSRIAERIAALYETVLQRAPRSA
jgi:teichuronic acid biosynthesis glycosyltransferase TuaC